MLDKLNEMPIAAKLGIAVAIVAVIVGLGWYFVVQPMQNDTADKMVELQKLQEKNKKLKDFETKVNQLERDIAALRAQMDLQKRIVPDDKEADHFIILLQDTATSTGVNLKKLVAKPIVNRDYYSEMPFAIEMDGNYYGLLAFFDRLSRQERIVNASDLQMAQLGNNPTATVSVQVTTKTFYSRPESEITAGPGNKGRK